MRKATKTLATIFALAIGLFPIAFGVLTNQKAQAAPLSSLYLLSPVFVAKSSAATFVYDSAYQEIKAIENGQITVTVAAEQEPVALTEANGHLFVLSSTKVSAFAFTPAANETPATLSEIDINSMDGDELGTQEFNFSGTSFSCFALVSESATEVTVFIQSHTNNNIEFHKYDFTYFAAQNTYGAKYNSVVYQSSQLNNPETDATGQITAFAAHKTADGYNFLATDNINIYGIIETSNPLICTIVASHAAVALCSTQTGFAYASSTEVKTTTSAFEQISTIAYSATALSSNKQTLVAIKSGEPKIEVLLPEESAGQSIFKNNYTEPEINHSQHKYGTTRVPQQILREFPYSITGISVASGQDLVILADESGEFEGYSYVTFVANGQNQYGYYPTEQIQTKDKENITYTAEMLVSTHLFALPSNVVDQTNTAISLPKGTKVEVIHNAANITNNDQKYLYVKTQNNEYGYVELAKTAKSITNPVASKTKANATINKNTTLFATKSTAHPILSISKGSRIKIKGLLNPTTKYTRVTIEDQTGETYQGYILTKNITPDNLTTLQVTGIVLLAVNAIVLLLIIGFYTINRKQRQTPPEQK